MSLISAHLIPSGVAKSWVTLVVASLCVVSVVLASILGFPSMQELFGNLDQLSLGNQPWRLFSSAFVFQGWMHFLVSMAGWMSLAPPLEQLKGWRWMAVVSAIVLVLGTISSAVMQDDLLSSGIESLVFGMSGIQTGRYFKGQIHAKELLPSGIWVVGLVALGILAPLGYASDLWLGLGGFLPGLTIGFLLRKPIAMPSQAVEKPVEQPEDVRAQTDEEESQQPEIETVEPTAEQTAEELPLLPEEDIAPFLPEPPPLEIPDRPA